MEFTAERPTLTLQTLVDTVSKITPREVTRVNHARQSEILGRFYRENVTLPIHFMGEIDMKSHGFFDKREYTKKWRSRDQLDQSMEYIPYTPVVYIGVSGAGKTYQIQRHAVDGFVLYTTAGDKIQERDAYFSKLDRSLLSVGSVDAMTFTLLWITIKLASLYIKLSKNNGYTPLEFALSQINGSTVYYEDCFEACLALNETTNFCNMESIHATLIANIRELRPNDYIGIAFDEAQMIINCHFGKYVTYFKYLYCRFQQCSDTEKKADTQYGLLYGISLTCSYLERQYDYIAYAGTKLTLKDAVVIQSASGLPKADLDIVVDLPYNSATNVRHKLNELINIDDVKLSADMKNKLTGRPHNVCYAVQLIKDDVTKSKVEILEQAITQSFESTRDVFADRIYSKLKEQEGLAHVVTLLLKIAIANLFKMEYAIKMSSDDTFDFVHAGIFHIRKSADEHIVIPTEPLGKAIIGALLQKIDAFSKEKSIDRQIALINKTISLLNSAQHTGTPMEIIIAESLIADGKMAKLASLAVAKSETNTDWIKDMKFQEWGTAESLEIKDDTDTTQAAQDLKVLSMFINKRKDHILLRPNQNFGPDLLGLCNIDGKKCSLWASVKLQKTVRAGEAQKAKSQMKPNEVYFSQRDKRKPKPNPSMKNYLQTFTDLYEKLANDRVLMFNIFQNTPQIKIWTLPLTIWKMVKHSLILI
jgi:hypothetical protein